MLGYVSGTTDTICSSLVAPAAFFTVGLAVDETSVCMCVCGCVDVGHHVLIVSLSRCSVHVMPHFTAWTCSHLVATDTPPHDFETPRDFFYIFI